MWIQLHLFRAEIERNSDGLKIRNKNLWKNDCSDSMHRNDQDSVCVHIFCTAKDKIARKKKCAHFHFNVFYHTAPCYDLDAVYAMLNTVIAFFREIRAECNIQKITNQHRTWYEFNNATVYFVVFFLLRWWHCCLCAWTLQLLCKLLILTKENKANKA